MFRFEIFVVLEPADANEFDARTACGQPASFVVEGRAEPAAYNGVISDVELVHAFERYCLYRLDPRASPLRHQLSSA